VRRPEIVVQPEHAAAVGFLCLTRADERGGPAARCRCDSCRSPVVLFSRRCRTSERVAAARLSIKLDLSYDIARLFGRSRGTLHPLVPAGRSGRALAPFCRPLFPPSGRR
jgi:hypothetical protein